MSKYAQLYIEAKHVKISAAAAASNELVAAVTDRRIVVLSLYVISASAVNGTFETDGSSNVAISGVMPLAQGITLPFNEAGWFKTELGEALDLLLSGAVQASGFLTYREARL